MRNISIKIFFTALFLGLALSQFTAAGNLVFPDTSYHETWVGNYLWLPAEGKQLPAGYIDPAVWIAKYPGTWDEPMVNFILGGSAQAAVKDTYWCIYNHESMCLFPSESLKPFVLKNENAGWDFAAFDSARAAIDIAALDSVDLSLAVWWDNPESAGKAIKDALKRYPRTNIAVIASDGKTLTEAKNFVSGQIDPESRSRVNTVTKNETDKRVDLSIMDKNPLRPFKSYEKLHSAHTHPGPVLFMRKIDWYDIDPDYEHKYRRCLVALSAHDKWTLYVNGREIHTSEKKYARFQDKSIMSRTYEVTKLMKPGENFFAVWVQPGSTYRGLIVNIKAGEMVYKSDSCWRAMPLKEKPDSQKVTSLIQSEQNWQKPLILSRPYILKMNPGKRFWHRLTPWNKNIEKPN